MSVSLTVGTIRLKARNHGTLSTVYDLALRCLNKCLYYRVMQCLVIDEVKPESIPLEPHFRFVRLEERELRTFAAQPGTELTLEFIVDALAKGDECFAILQDDALASYGWYSRAPTLTNSPDLRLHFDPNYIYMYKAFTLERYRGQRLHAAGVTRSLAYYRAKGFRGLISYVESNNFDSLKSSYRMGYRQCGRIRVMRLAGRYLINAEPQCRTYSLKISAACPFKPVHAILTES